MQLDDHPHWSVYVSCAVLTTASFALLIVSDISDVRDVGRWGMITGLAALVLGCVIVCHLYARKVCEVAHEEVEHAVEDVDDLLNQKAAAMIVAYDERTGDIAESVCAAVLQVMNHHGPTPVGPRRGD